MMIYQFYSKHK